MNSYYFETRNNPLFLQEDKNICLPGKAGQQTYQHGDRGSEMQPKSCFVSQTDLSNGIPELAWWHLIYAVVGSFLVLSEAL